YLAAYMASNDQAPTKSAPGQPGRAFLSSLGLGPVLPGGDQPPQPPATVTVVPRSPSGRRVTPVTGPPCRRPLGPGAGPPEPFPLSVSASRRPSRRAPAPGASASQLRPGVSLPGEVRRSSTRTPPLGRRRNGARSVKYARHRTACAGGL